MNEFVRLILGELQGALGLISVGLLLCVAILGVVYIVFQEKNKKEREFPWKKAILILLFAGYTVIVLYATILRGTGYGTKYINLHLFRAWKEVWNSFSVKTWLNVLLNIALFVPLGILLPCFGSTMKKWYVMLGAGFGVSFLIEILQYILNRGLFDIDDLFANTLGAMLGFCIVMFIASVQKKEERLWKKSVAYALLPIVTVAAISGIFIAYQLQEYGNLTTAAVYKTNTKDIEWILMTDLDDSQQMANVYRTEIYDKEACDDFGRTFFDKIDVELQDIRYYDEETWFCNHNSPGHFLMVSRLDKSYTYHTVDMENNAWAETDEETLRKMLLAYGIEIPESASFSYLGEGMHQFSVEPYTNSVIQTEVAMMEGIVQCRFTEQGTIREINNHLLVLEFYKEEPVISKEEAYKQLCAGNFTGNFEFYKPEKIEVKSCELEYTIDTKGFYQPVYSFEISDEKQEYDDIITIPALK